MKFDIKDEQLAFQALRMLSEVSSGQADVNEVMDTAQEIEGGNYESWYQEWTKTADRVRNIADVFLAQGHYVSAAETYLRASNYYRAAGFYRGVLIVEGCNAETKHRLEQLDILALDCFSQVIRYGNTAIEPVEVPYGNTTLPGHFYRVPAKEDSKSAPTLIMMNGYDGTKEELYGFALAALKRGMNCFTFEGPGQGEMIRKKGIPFRPDWENVVTPVIDHLIVKLGVNPDNIILWGESMGGYLAPRAAAFDHRIAACVANSGIYDFIGCHAPEGMGRHTFFEAISHASETEIETALQVPLSHPQVDWAFKHGMYVFGATNLKDFLLKAKEYYLEGSASQIKCPTLVTDSKNETNFPGEAKKLYASLRCPKDYLLFTKQQGTAEHCQQGAKIYATGCIFNWIEDHLPKSCEQQA
ncbi:MAG: dipeptidyl aminopeptidase [Spirochaetia bacterium]|jgi:pimeloyl-ACP methyl ester carboxylesterase|nr:dipeptidyl aminopeptidase [Spirochaetia bacterium]